MVMVLLMSFGDALVMVIGWALLALFVTIPFVLFVNKINGGRGLLYKVMKDHGPDSPITNDILTGIVERILKSEGIDFIDLSIGHEVGNRFSGVFYDPSGGEHDIRVNSDGWHVHYSIDGGRFAKWE